MQTSDIISIIALGVSVASLGVSGYVAFVDRGRLRAKSHFYPAYKDRDDDSEQPASMRVEAVNTGRRPIILTMFGADYENGHWRGTYIGGAGKGVRLGENEKFTEQIDRTHHMLFNHEDDEAATDFWFEDTLGRRYRVKGAKEHLLRMFKNERHPSEEAEASPKAEPVTSSEAVKTDA